mmetsp:Transcript_55294/g.140253  ORF Transcript_55294/g.140253 Transcript_55294/m.140253 type:complete len:243 (+) Transcript_55294:60-788(+)
MADAAFPAAPAAELSAPASSSSAPAGPKEGQESMPKSYLLLFNVGKRQNFGTLLRSACAFGVSEVFVVGAKKLATFGNQGTAGYSPERYFDTLETAKADCVARGIRICGIEIDESARPVQEHPFSGPTAFMLGNEGIGMSPQQRAACNFFVYIPQHSGATASLNVAIAGSIVLHHFALWARLPEQARSGEKYVLDRRDKLERYTNPCETEKSEMDRKRAERAAKRQLENCDDVNEAMEDEDA